MKKLLSDIYSIYWREMKHYFKSKSLIFMSVTQPIIWLILMGMTMNNMVKASQVNKMINESADYISYLTPGIMLMTALFSGLYGGVSILNDRKFGYLNKILSSPINRISIPIGENLAIVTQSAIQVTIVIVLALIIGARYKTGFIGIFVMILITCLFCSVMAAISLLLSIKMNTHQAVYAFISFITMPLMFTSSAIFPEISMPGWIKIISKINPITYAIKPMRLIGLTGWTVNGIGFNMVILLIIVLVINIIAIFKFKKIYSI